MVRRFRCKVGYSGRDEGVSYLLSNPSEEVTPEQIQAAYQKRFSTFQEDLPLLNAITPSSIVLEEEITIVQSANYRVIDSFTAVNATDVVFGLLVAGALIGLFVAPQVELPAILSSLITLITSSLPALVAA